MSCNQALREITNVIRSVLPQWDMGQIARKHLAQIEAWQEEVAAKQQIGEVWSTNMAVYVPASAMDAVADVNWRLQAVLVKRDATEADKISIAAPSLPQMEGAIIAVRDVVRQFKPDWKGEGDARAVIEKLDRADAE